MKLKKFLLRTSTISLVITPAISMISCNFISSKEKKLDYDFGYATSDITSLNYIKYLSSVGFCHSVVESFKKEAPIRESSLANYLNKFPRVYLKSADQYLEQPLSSNSGSSGVLKSQDFLTDDRVEYPAIASKDDHSNTFVVRLNGKSKWSNGKKLIPSDFIDAFVYVLDLNSGSQLLQNFLNINIKNSNEFVAVQTKYSKKYSKLYKNPFGYIKNEDYFKKYDVEDKRPSYYVQTKYKFPLQIYTKNTNEINKMSHDAKIDYLKNQDEERKIVDKIEFTAKNLGLYADLNSSHPYTNIKDVNGNALTSDIKTSKFYKFNDDSSYKQDSETIYPNVLQIVISQKKDSSSFFYSLFRSYWIPVNRQFVESIGGIEKFGLNSKNFLTQGPFKIASIILGTSGSIILEKNKDYWDARNTIPNRVKIFFQTDPIVLSSYFEDEYISTSNLNGIAVQKLYTTKEYRNLLKKSGGVGSTAIVFNLDKNSLGHNKILADPNLRKALFYTIDRNEIIKLSGYDSTVPIYSFIDGSYDTETKWLSSQRGAISMLQKIGDSIYYDKYKPNEPKKMFPYKVSSYFSKDQLVGNFDRTDIFKNKELALKYFNDFLKDNPGNHKITFAHDSTKPVLQIGIAIQSAVKKIFGNKLKVEIKGYPKSIYDSFISSGNFEFTYKNLDYLSNVQKIGGIDAFYKTDEINKKDQKNIGFINNPTGGWTFNEIIKNKINSINLKEKEIKNRLEISDIIWNKIFELLIIPQAIREKSIEDRNVFITQRLDAFLNSSDFEFDGVTYPVDKNFKNSNRIVELAKVSNKLLLEYSPIIPLFIVDNTYSISRLVNYRIPLILLSFDYGYDYKRKPIKNLPGREAIL